jgi:hypothetical protein
MQSAVESTKGVESRAKLWTGRIMGGLVILFLLLDAIGKLMKPEAVVKGTMELGFPVSAIVPIGVTLLICTVLYAIPRTSLLGAILLTGYLGGAVATQVRVGNPLFSHVLFPVYFGILIWGSLYLLEPRVRTMIPFRS